MGFFDRLGQVLKGKASNAVAGVENANPEAVYEAAIAERERKYIEIKKASAGLIHLRDQKKDALGKAERELARVEPSIGTAVGAGEDEAALVLLEQKETLTGQIETLTVEVTSLEGQVKESVSALRAYKDEVAKLKREKTEMLARNQTAEARIQAQETISGLSADADVQGLASVREHIHGLEYDAGIDEERGRVTDADLARSKAKLQLAALKRQIRGEDPPQEEATAGDAAADDAAAGGAAAGGAAADGAAAGGAADGATPPDEPVDDTPKRTL